jgi:catechol 2,3-dioxygenase-like lactoylglutathione lyase family enzyme
LSVPDVFSHFGICVSDLDQSLRFYCEGLGFSAAESHQIGSEFARLMEFDDVALRSQFIRREHVAIELLSFVTPPPVGEATRRAVNQLGLTHLSFRTDDVAGTAARLEQLGGHVVKETETAIEFGETKLLFVYCTDPDGVRIELMDLGA